VSLLDDKIDLFLTQAALADRKANYLPMLAAFFGEPGSEAPHVIYKRSVLYFFHGAKLMQTHPIVAARSTDATVYTFDGERIGRIQPAYYLGTATAGGKGAGSAGAASGSASSSFLLFDDGGSSNNNNNNNGNNNNG